MPPSSPSPCDEPLCSPAIVSCVFCCRGCGAPPRRLESCPWFPGGCAGRAWRSRACLRHGCGPRTPPRAQGWPLASRAAREATATRWSLGASVVLGSLSTSKANVKVGRALSRARFCRLMRKMPCSVAPAASAPSLVTRWTRHALCARTRARLQAGRRTPAPCRDQACGQPSRRALMRTPPSWEMSRGAL
jgi:hypothetical protein